PGALIGMLGSLGVRKVWAALLFGTISVERKDGRTAAALPGPVVIGGVDEVLAQGREKKCPESAACRIEALQHAALQDPHEETLREVQGHIALALALAPHERVDRLPV